MPFIQTAQINNEAEEFLHIAGWRLRVIGSGNIDSILYTLDSVGSETQTVIVNSTTNRYEPTQLSNFREQRAMLKISTDVIDEWIDVSRIIFFVNKLWSEKPR